MLYPYNLLSTRELGNYAAFSFKATVVLILCYANKCREYYVSNSTLSSDSDKLSYENISSVLQAQNVIVDAAEVHGILCGMLAGGMNIDDKDWVSALADVINQGDTLAPNAQNIIDLLFNQTCQQFIEADFALSMCLPNDNASINQRGEALVNWVQGFLLGFGMHQNDLTNCSDEAKEALEDFTQIAKLDEAMEENEESEQAFFEVIEYVRISAMLCFNEMGKSLIDSRQQSPVIH